MGRSSLQNMVLTCESVSEKTHLIDNGLNRSLLQYSTKTEFEFTECTYLL